MRASLMSSSWLGPTTFASSTGFAAQLPPDLTRVLRGIIGMAVPWIRLTQSGYQADGEPLAPLPPVKPPLLEVSQHLPRHEGRRVLAARQPLPDLRRGDAW